MAKQKLWEGEKSPIAQLSEDLKRLQTETNIQIALTDKLKTSLGSIQATAKSSSVITGDKNGLDTLKRLNEEHLKAIALLEKEKATRESLRLITDNLSVTKKQQIAAETALNKQRERALQQIEKEVAKQTRLSSVYSKVDQKLSNMVKEYRDLAVRKELNIKLTEKENSRMDFLATKITKYDQALKATDANSGRFQRKFGDYASGFNTLNNSVNQLTREMPAFANSMQTGFMAISNNLPMFFDEISKLKKANIELAKSGEPTKNVFKSLSSAIFSTSSLLSIGVTLLTVYGAKMIDFLSGSKKSEEQLKREKEQQEALNKKRKEGSEFVGRESAELVTYLMGLKQTNEGSKERLELMTKINNQFGTTIKNLSDESQFQNQVNALIYQYIQLQRDAYKVKKSQTLAELNITKQEEQFKIINKSLRLTRKEFDMISQKSGGFSLLATELQQGVAPVETIAEQLGISEKRAKQLVLRYRNLQEQDKKTIDINDKKIEQDEKLGKFLTNTIGLTDENKLSEEDRAKQLIKSLIAQDGLATRLYYYGGNLADASLKMNDLNIKSDINRGINEKSTEQFKNLNTELKEYDDWLQRRLEHATDERKLIDELNAITQENQVKIRQKVSEEMLQDALDLATKTGEVYIDTLEKTINDEFDLRAEAAQNRSQMEIEVLMKSIETTRALETERLIREKDELLKQEGLTAEQKTAINNSFEQRMAELRVRMLQDEKVVALKREKIELELNATLGDLNEERAKRLKQVNDELIDAQKQYAEGTKKVGEKSAKDEIKTEKGKNKELADLRKKSIDELIQMQINKSKRIEDAIDKEISANQKLQDSLKEQANLGVDTAQQSLATLKEQEAEKTKAKEKEAKKQETLERIKVAYSLFEASISKGDNIGTASAKTTAGMSIVEAIIQSFKKFYHGTDDTGSTGMMRDQFGAITGVTHENETVLSKSDKKDLGFISRQDLKEKVKLANSILYEKQLKTSTTQNFGFAENVANSLNPLGGKLDRLISLIENQPTQTLSEEVVDGIGRAVVATYTKGNDKLTKIYN